MGWRGCWCGAIRRGLSCCFCRCVPGGLRLCFRLCGGYVVVRYVGLMFAVVIFLVAVLVLVAASVALIDIFQARPAEVRAASAFHVVASKHALQSMAAFWALLVAPGLQQCFSLCIEAELIDVAYASRMCRLSALHADACFASRTCELLRIWCPNARVNAWLVLGWHMMR